MDEACLQESTRLTGGLGYFLPHFIVRVDPV